MPWDGSRNEEQKGTKDIARNALAEIYEKGEETMVPVIQMMGSWKLYYI